MTDPAFDSMRQLAAGFDLAKLPPEFYDDPFPTYRALREHEPVKRMPDGSYFLTRYADLEQVYKNTKVFSSDKKREFKPKYGDSLLYEQHTTSLVFNDLGVHQCAGMNLARLEGSVAISRFVARFRRYELDGQPRRGGRARFRGFLRVPVRLHGSGA